MTLSMILTTAYGAVGALGVCAYFPQLLKLVRDKSRSEHVPLSTWLLWGIQTQVVTTYALLVNGDVAFIAVNLFTMVACNSCLAVLLYNRYLKQDDMRLADVLREKLHMAHKTVQTVAAEVQASQQVPANVVVLGEQRVA